MFSFLLYLAGAITHPHARFSSILKEAVTVHTECLGIIQLLPSEAHVLMVVQWTSGWEGQATERTSTSYSSGGAVGPY